VFALSAVDANMRYQIHAGGTWTDTYAITMIRRPIIQSISGGGRRSK